jgi:hypothetical protein
MTSAELLAERGNKIVCRSCHNRAVITEVSLVWNYAYEGREGLGAAVMNSEPRTPPKRAAVPKVDELEINETSAWVGAVGVRTNVAEKEALVPNVEKAFRVDTVNRLIAEGRLKRVKIKTCNSPAEARAASVMEPTRCGTADELLDLFKGPK